MFQAGDKITATHHKTGKTRSGKVEKVGKKGNLTYLQCSIVRSNGEGGFATYYPKLDKVVLA